MRRTVEVAADDNREVPGTSLQNRLQHREYLVDLPPPGLIFSGYELLRGHPLLEHVVAEVGQIVDPQTEEEHLLTRRQRQAHAAKAEGLEEIVRLADGEAAHDRQVGAAQVEVVPQTVGNVSSGAVGFLHADHVGFRAADNLDRARQPLNVAVPSASVPDVPRQHSDFRHRVLGRGARHGLAAAVPPGALDFGWSQPALFHFQLDLDFAGERHGAVSLCAGQNRRPTQQIAELRQTVDSDVAAVVVEPGHPIFRIDAEGQVVPLTVIDWLAAGRRQVVEAMLPVADVPRPGPRRLQSDTPSPQRTGIPGLAEVVV